MGFEFRFFNIQPYSKVKNENRQHLMCDTSKELHGLSDHKSEEKMKKLNLT